MGLVLPLIIAAIFFFESSNAPGGVMAYFVPIVVCWFFPMYEANNLSYDGTPFAMHLFAGLSGRNDRTGRARVALVIGGAYLLLAFIVTLIIARPFNSPYGFPVSIAILGGGIAMLFCAVGVAECISTFMMYPAPSIKTPMKNPQGRSLAQVLYSLASIVFPMITMIPTIVVFIVMLVVGNLGLLWVVGLVGVVNGIIIFWIGVRIGGSVLSKHANNVFHKLENFATLQG
jgi:ABC-2 type transport system permease protein